MNCYMLQSYICSGQSDKNISVNTCQGILHKDPRQLYFKSLFFDFAPLMAVPAYQEEPVQSLEPDAQELSKSHMVDAPPANFSKGSFEQELIAAVMPSVIAQD